MNLATIVLNAFAAIPGGIRGIATFSRTVPGTYDSTNGTRTGDSTETFSCNSVLVPPKNEYAEGVIRRPGYESTLIIPAGACTFTPQVDMLVTINSVKWRIVAREVLDPSGANPYIYTFGVSR